MIEISERGSVRILRMAHGKVNALDTELLRGLRDALRDADREGVPAVVVTGAGGAFSAGVDLFRIVDGGERYVREFLPLLSDVLVQWFRFPRPMVAAINGHAIAGGAILAWCADWRLMSAGPARIGVPELRVGVPFPLAPLEIVRFAVAGQRLLDLVYRGLTLTPEGAHACGLVDDVVAPESMIEHALAAALELSALPPKAFQLAKEGLRGPTLDRIAREAAGFDERALAEWSAPGTAARIRTYLQQVVGKAR